MGVRMMDRKRLQELRAEHRPWREGASICVRSGCQGWPCEQSQILDLALTCFDEQFGVARMVELKDEVERLEEKWKAFDSLRVEAMNKADAWREEAERLRAALTSVRAQLERAMNRSGSDLSKFALVREIDVALAGTEAKS